MLGILSSGIFLVAIGDLETDGVLLDNNNNKITFRQNLVRGARNATPPHTVMDATTTSAGTIRR